MPMFSRFQAMSRVTPLIAATALLFAAAPAQAQSADAAGYPNKPVKIVVAVPAGGGVDTVTRIVAERLKQIGRASCRERV